MARLDVHMRGNGPVGGELPFRHQRHQPDHLRPDAGKRLGLGLGHSGVLSVPSGSPIRVEMSIELRAGCPGCLRPGSGPSHSPRAGADQTAVAWVLDPGAQTPDEGPQTAPRGDRTEVRILAAPLSEDGPAASTALRSHLGRRAVQPIVALRGLDRSGGRPLIPHRLHRNRAGVPADQVLRFLEDKPAGGVRP